MTSPTITTPLPAPDISSQPSTSQAIHHSGKDYTTIKEGLAYILIPASASPTPQTAPRGENVPQSVFYNPIQQFNRDLSVLAIKAYGEEAVERKRALRERRVEKVVEKRIAGKKRKRGLESTGVGEEVSGKKVGEGERRVEDVTEKARGAKEVENNGIRVESNTNGAAKDTEKNRRDEKLNLEPPPTIEEPEAAGPAAKAEGDISMPDAEAQSNDPEPAQDNSRPQSSNPATKPFIPSFTILDALSATGLRALRYAQEISFTTSVTANDLLPAATESIELNVKHNKLEDKIKTITGNALTHMYSFVSESHNPKDQRKPSGKYDVIDLDPYGTAAPFLDAAVQSVRDDGGLLCVTCTDAGVWASNGYPEKSYSLYGGTSFRGDHCHENGLRLILHAIASTAARYGLAMEPLLSLSIDFYARVFVRIYRSPADVKFLAGKTMLVHNCDSGCGAWTTQLLARNKLAPNKNGKGHFWKHILAQSSEHSGKCEHCGTKTHVAGPVYAGPLHNPAFIKKILDSLPSVSKETYATKDRIEGMLTLALEEVLPSSNQIYIDSPTASSKTHRHDPAILDEYPFFFIPSSLAKVVHCVTPHENALRGALMHLGYRVTRSHTKPGSIKTDAPWSVLWEVMREWIRQKAPVREGAVRTGTAGWKILRLNEKDGEEGKKEEEEKEADGKVSGIEGNGNGEEKTVEVKFDEELGKQKDGRKLVRYQLNPRENWGPMNRATGHA